MYYILQCLTKLYSPFLVVAFCTQTLNTSLLRLLLFFWLFLCSNIYFLPLSHVLCSLPLKYFTHYFYWAPLLYFFYFSDDSLHLSFTCCLEEWDVPYLINNVREVMSIWNVLYYEHVANQICLCISIISCTAYLPVTNAHMSLTLMTNTSADSAGVDVLIYDQWYCDNKGHINTVDYITSCDNTNLLLSIGS